MLTQDQIKLLNASVNNTAKIGKEVDILKENISAILKNQQAIIKNQELILSQLPKADK